MLTVTNNCIVFQAFFSNFQKNHLHNFARHWNETDRSVINSNLFLFLPENWDFRQLPVDWDLSRFGRLLKNNWERLHSGISHLTLGPLTPLQRWMWFVIFHICLVYMFCSSNQTLRVEESMWRHLGVAGRCCLITQLVVGAPVLRQMTLTIPQMVFVFTKTQQRPSTWG